MQVDIFYLCFGGCLYEKTTFSTPTGVYAQNLDESVWDRCNDALRLTMDPTSIS